MKCLVALFALAAIVAAEPEADASVFYGGYGYGYPAVYGGYGAYGYGGYAPYNYGAYGYGAHLIGKRDADAQVLAYTTPYVYAYPAASSYQSISTPFHVSAHSQIHKREAEPQGVAVHPGLATSSTFRSVQGAAGLSLNPFAYPYNYHLIGKREAEPQGVAVHPGLATSSTFRSVQGAAGLSLYPYAYANYPYVNGYF